MTARFRPICFLWEYPVRRRVSDKVGNTRNNRAELIEPIPEDTPKGEKSRNARNPRRSRRPKGCLTDFPIPANSSVPIHINLGQPTIQSDEMRTDRHCSRCSRSHPPRHRRNNCLSTRKDFYFVSVLLSGTVMLLGCFLYLRALSRHLLSGMTRRPTPRPPGHV